MITNGKEYPATHSMSTAWYFVDKDDNVAIFDINDNGPVPAVALNSDSSIEDLCFDFPVDTKDGRKMLNLTDEQVELMFCGLWKSEVDDDHYWYDSVFQIDVDREKEFLDYLSNHRRSVRQDWDISFDPVCLSRKLGIYMVDLDEEGCGDGMNNPHARFLFESGIALRYCKYPRYDDFDDDWDRYKDFYPDANCPYYLYCNEYLAETPHKRVSVPRLPVKLSQMPEKTRDRIIRLNLRFAESESIQIAAEVPCYQTIYADEYGAKRTADGYWYAEVKMPSGEVVYVLNTEHSEIPGDIPFILPKEK